MLRNLPDRKLWIGLALPLLVNIYIIIVWRGQGSWYGYRYLLFVAMPVLALPFGFLLMHLRVRRSTLFYFACALGIFPLVSMLMFEAGPGLWLAIYKNEYGATPWTHPTFQKAVWSTVFATPKDAIFYVVKAGPCYVVYLLAHALGFAAALPEKFLKVYPFLDKELIIKSLLIYALPWVLYLKRGRKSLKAYASTS